MLSTYRIVLCFTTSMLDFLCLYCSMFSSDVLIMTIPMILSMAWDVTRGGWLGPTMVLWCHWWLRGTTYLVVIFLIAMLIMFKCDVAFSSLWFFPFCTFPSLFDRWLDSSFPSFSYSNIVWVFMSWDVDPVIPSVEVLYSIFPLLCFL